MCNSLQVLRCEIAGLAPKLGITDQWVLYTDCDIMFTGEVCDILSRLRPRWFAVAREDIHNPRSMNSGVMLMNLHSLRTVDVAFRKFTRRYLSRFVGRAWDQDAYRLYFVAGPRPVGDGWWSRLLTMRKAAERREDEQPAP